MNILIITGIFPPDIGGPATYVPQIANGLVERGHEITVLTLSDSLKSGARHPAPKTQHPKPNTQHLVPDSPDILYPFRVVRLARQLFKPWRWLWTALCIVRLGKRTDVLFVNGLAMEAVLANLLLRKPMVQKVVGDLAWERATNKGWVSDDFETFQTTRYDLRTTYGRKIELLKRLRSWWTRSADQIIAPSRYLARWIASWGIPEERISVIYNALEPLNGIKPAPLPFDHLPHTTNLKLKVVTVGRLVRWKGVVRLLEAIGHWDEVGLIVIGEGPERPNLEEQARALGIIDRVYFAGQRSHKETLSFMAACDLFVLNSTYEGFPHVLLEAMTLGLPVIATAVGGTPEAVQDRENGRLIELTDHGLLQETLSELISSPLERERLARGATRTAAQFRLSATLEKTEGVLRAAAHPRSGL